MRDPGLQPERTSLAWRRTVVAAAGVALVCSITAVRTGVLAVAIVAAVLAGGIAVTSVIGPVRLRMSAAGEHSRPWAALALVAGCICTVSVLGVALAVLGAMQG